MHKILENYAPHYWALCSQFLQIMRAVYLVIYYDSGT